jgi:predicted MarR family transcription regulator
MHLGKAEQQVLAALVSGQHLKSHRYLDGRKVYALHDVANTQDIPVAATVVDHLRDLGLIAGNMKFPAATYLLTPAGERVAASLTQTPFRPLLARLFPGR